VVHGRPILGDDALQREREQVGRGHRGDGQEEDARSTKERGQERRDRGPDKTQRADPRQTDEDPVEPADPVEDDEALDVSVERNQTGTICFA
jgi:hypothetical protein